MFDPARLEGPGDLENEDSDVGQALRDLFETTEGSYLKRGQGWRVVYQTDDMVEALAPVSEDRFVSARFERSGDGWNVRGFGDCKPSVVVGDRSPMTWKFAQPPSPEATRLVLIGREMACASARQLSPEQVEADIIYSEDRVSVVLSADPIRGGTCPGNPTVEVTVDLEEPLGNRTVVDAAIYLPTPRGS